MKRKYKPSLWWLALAPVFLAAGVGGGTTILLNQALQTGLDATFTVPVTRTFDIEEPGTYTLAHEYKIIFSGRKYDEDPTLPGSATIALTGPEGDVVMKESSRPERQPEKHQRVELGRFAITEPGSYSLSVTGLDAKRVLTFRQALAARIIISSIVGILLNLIGWFGAPAVFIIVLSSRLKNKRQFKAEHPELFKPTEPLRG